MKRTAVALVVVALAATFTLVWATLQPSELEAFNGYVRSSLHLISQESKPDWSPRWTGPIEAATILAWLHQHGYSEFLQDYNEDGEIDELDTIELADILGKHLMQTETPVGTNDARLVIGLARYVAERYPGEFVLKIYDPGFPAEFEAEGETFAPDAIPGIELRLMGEATLEAYKHEMETAEGVIVGLEESEGENTYLAGRSYLYEETPAGYTPVDFAWSEEDRFEPGNQGRILETVAMQDDFLYVDYRMGFTYVECMLALSPIDHPDFVSMHYNCPDDALAYHVTENTTPHGTIRVEECVIREGDYDIYVWIVTNIDFLWDGCGVCTFGVANSGISAVSHSGPPFWNYTQTPWGWFWTAPPWSCGFEKNQTAVFAVIVPGPTMDAWVPAMVRACGPPMSPRVPSYGVRTTGPLEIDLGDCPDIELRVDDHSCSTEPDGSLKITVWPSEIENVGGAPVTTAFTVVAFAPGYSGSTGVNILGPDLPFNPGDVIALPSMVFTIPAGEVPDPPCPIGIRVVADSSFAVDECGREANNTVDFDECCTGLQRGACCFPDGTCLEMTGPDCEAEGGTYEGTGTTCATIECPTDEDCPDLAIEIGLVTCSCRFGVTQRAEFSGSATVTVTNIGTAPSPSLTDGVYFSPGGDSKNLPALGPSDSTSMTFHFSGTAQSCDGLVINCFAIVDPDNDIAECNDGNNTASHDEDCD